MDISINTSFLSRSDPEESLAFYRDALGFEVRKDVGYNECGGSQSVRSEDRI